MRFSENFIQEVLDRTDIEELIGRYVTLRRTGSNLVGLCPFHSEKTPSFSVTPAKKMFFCFGCHAGGSAITFIQKAENLEFADAVEYLANRAGLPLPKESDAAFGDRGLSRKRVLAMNLEAAKFFRECLYDPKLGQSGMEYLRNKRQLSDATVRHFGLGFAPDSFGLLTDHMRRLGYTDDELVEGYLCRRNEKTGRIYDCFRNRVMFPIIDTAGNVVAFGGRVMDDSKPKYLNSSDTPAFKKSKQLYALNFAKSCCSERMILCEGYMDVIALHAAGFPFAVATLGTAITPDHARIFSKYTKKVIISYDADAAGQNAANKAMRILGEVGMEVRVLKTTDAKDPDEFIRKFGADRFRKLLNESRTGFEYKLDGILMRYDLSQGSEKIRASRDICELIAGYSSAVEREVYLTNVSKKLELPVDVLKNSVEIIRRKQLAELRNRQSREAQTTLKNFGDRVNPEAAQNPRAAAAEETVLGLLFLYPEYRSLVVEGKITLTEEMFVTDFHRRVFHAILEREKSEAEFNMPLLVSEFSPDETGRIYAMETARSALTQNGIDVFRSAVNTLTDLQIREAVQKRDISDQVAYLREKKRKLHKEG